MDSMLRWRVGGKICQVLTHKAKARRGGQTAKVVRRSVKKVVLALTPLFDPHHVNFTR